MRFFKWAKGELDASALEDMIRYEKLKAYDDTKVYVESGGENWLITHQDGYSKLTGRIGVELAAKHRVHVITHHEHAAGILRDMFNWQTVVSNGGLFKAEAMHYVQQYSNTRKAMTQSFVMLKEGTAHLLTPYPTWTDWSMYI